MDSFDDHFSGLSDRILGRNIMPRDPITRQQFLRAAIVLGLPVTQRFGQAQTANPRWSEAAVKKLKEEQEMAYGHLGEQLGLGNDPMKVYRYLTKDRIPLERISPQKFEQTFGPIFGKAEGWADALESAKAYTKAYSKYRDAEPPTPYEDPNWYSVLLEMADSIDVEIKAKEQALKASKASIPPHIVVGSLPTGDVNAKTERVPGTSDYLVLFHYGLFMFAFQMSKIAARAFPPLVPDGIGVKFDGNPNPGSFLRSHPEILAQFNRVLHGYLVVGNPRLTPSFQIEDPYLVSSMSLLRSMELFMLGHEYAHILLRHLEKRHDPQDEYDADELGMSIMIQVMGPDYVRYSFWGADYILSCYDVVERCLSVLRNGSVVESARSSSHPPAPKRREQLRTALRELRPGGESEKAIGLGVQLQTFVDELWQKSLADWVKLHNEGTRPSEIWG